MLAVSIASALLICASATILWSLRRHEAASAIVLRVDADPVRTKLQQLSVRQAELRDMLDERGHR